jgi:hypothetical protein
MKETGIKNKQIKRFNQRIKRLEKAEAKIRQNWRKQYKKHLAYTGELVIRSKKNLRPDTKKAQQIMDFLQNWETLSKKLTQKRDEIKEKIQLAKDERDGVSLQLKKLQLDWDNDLKEKDHLISLIFNLNDKVVEALEERNRVLNENVFGLLIKDNGDLRSQLSLENSAGTHKVVALVNSIQIIKSEFAEAAKEKINTFFDRYKQNILKDNPTLQRIYKLTEELLIDKRNFRIGPSFYIFISLEINAEEFPELAKAQEFLRASIRSEKTNSYIRLYERENRNGKWVSMKQK